MRLLVLFAPATVLLMGAAPNGASIALHGTDHGALPCQACHGMRFQGDISIGAPALAGQSVSVMLNSLTAIAAGKMGKNYVMKNIAASLTPAERKAVTAYLAGLPAPK